MANVLSALSPDRLRLALQAHWTEYLIEAGGLGLFMVSAGLFGTLLEAPISPINQAIPDPFIRRSLMGLAMGTTAILLIYSRWGMRSGAHFNPAFTLAFYRLGKIEPPDAVFYITAQFLGAVAGVLAVDRAIGRPFEDAPVRFVGTFPGAGDAVAFVAEVVISAILMTVVLHATNRMRIHRYTGLIAGSLVALYIMIEAPISGMSLNPARSFGSAAVAGLWSSLWIYFLAPPAGMLLAATIYQRRPDRKVICAKLHHDNDERCIFRCGYSVPAGSMAAAAPLTEQVRD